MTQKTNTLLDDGLFLDAASGAGPLAVRVLAACHAELNDAAAQRLDCAETAFGALLETSPSAPIGNALFARTMAELEAEDEAVETADGSSWADMPKTLCTVLPDQDETDWSPRFGGMNEIVLDDLCEPGVHVRLLKLPAGWRAPEHTHGGDEITLVIQGSFRDEVSRYAAGDVCHAASGHLHRPVVDSDEDCICLAVEFGPLKPTNPFLSAAGAVLGRLF